MDRAGSGTLTLVLSSRQTARAVTTVGLILVIVSGVGLIFHRARPVERGTVPADAVQDPTPGVVAPPATTTPTRQSVISPSAALRPGGATPTAGNAPSGVGIFPGRIDIPTLHVSAPIEPEAVDVAGALGVPANPTAVGWWVGGPLPGSAAGTTVLDGHVDSAAAGPGALFELRRVEVGAIVTVSGDGGDVRYRITGVREYNKDTLPSSTLFVRTGTPRLVMITCGGPFNAATHHYRDNIVAFGTLLPAV
jgi:hypothetical protein